MELNDLFSPSQHGGLRKRGIVSQLLEALENWNDNLDHGVQTDVLYFDFEKAFDRIPHQGLLKQLNSYGIRGNLLKWIRMDGWIWRFPVSFIHRLDGHLTRRRR